MPRDKNARVECWRLLLLARGFDSFFLSFFPLLPSGFLPFFVLLFWDGIRVWEWSMGIRGEVFYLCWRVDELKFEKVGGIYFKWG